MRGRGRITLATLALLAALAACDELPGSFPVSSAPSSGGDPSFSVGESGSAPPAVSGSPSVEPSATPEPVDDEFSLAQLLALLPTAPEDRTGYDRDLFVHWIDDDSDGCDTRREVLIAESVTTVTVSAPCALADGSWQSVYDGLAFTDATQLDIDHVVALGEAWDSGARDWGADRRRAYANDLGVAWALIAVSASSNRSKGDKDPAEWLPPVAADLCSYLGDWLAVKVRWSLSVDSAERAALDGLIGGCPETRRVVVLAPPPA